MPKDFLLFLTAMLRVYASMLDDSANDDITLDEIKRQCAAGHLFDFLQRRGGDSIDLSMLRGQTELMVWYVTAVAGACRSFSGRERRKLGLENRGLCLLVAITAELLQHPENMKL